MNAEPALTELLEVSPQIEAAVIAERSGANVWASSFAHGDDRAESLVRFARSMLDEAEHVRTQLGREPVVQLEAATGDGSVFIVHDERNMVIAVTSSDPTVGLVFYDLKTALRTMHEPVGSER